MEINEEKLGPNFCAALYLIPEAPISYSLLFCNLTDVNALRQLVLHWDDCQCLETVQIVTTEGLYWHLVGRGLDSAKILQCKKSHTTTKNYPVWNVNSATAEKPRIRRAYSKNLLKILPELEVGNISWI